MSFHQFNSTIYLTVSLLMLKNNGETALKVIKGMISKLQW